MLEQELKTFERELPRLLETARGRYVLIRGETVDSTWPSADEAYTAGCERFGVEPFLVMPVKESEPAVPVLQELRRADP